MPDYSRFQKRPTAPSRQSIETTVLVIKGNLEEMKIIVTRISAEKKSPPGADKYRLLYMGSCFYDFYLLAEDCLLHIARTIDKWVPGSLDWHQRLVKLMQCPLKDKRPPVLSAETASLLDDYLCLFLNFHHQCSTLSSSRIENMTANIRPLYDRLEKELAFITNYPLG